MQQEMELLPPTHINVDAVSRGTTKAQEAAWEPDQQPEQQHHPDGHEQACAPRHPQHACSDNDASFNAFLDDSLDSGYAGESISSRSTCQRDGAQSDAQNPQQQRQQHHHHPQQHHLCLFRDPPSAASSVEAEGTYGDRGERDDGRHGSMVDRLYESASVLPEDFSVKVQIGFDSSAGFPSHQSVSTAASLPVHFDRQSISRVRSQSDGDEPHVRLERPNYTGLTEGSDLSGLHVNVLDIEANRVVGDDDETAPKGRGTTCAAALKQAFYLSIFGILGSTAREFAVRLFGADCEAGVDAIQDFLHPYFSHICLTAGGRTLQAGGALFRDLPSNIIGSFLLGMVTPKSRFADVPIPWIASDNPIQTDRLLNTALTVGFCGCLTSFASWNSQMVIMLDGYGTVLGSQIPTVIFGYLLGILTSISAFRLGMKLNSASNSAARENRRQRAISHRKSQRGARFSKSSSALRSKRQYAASFRRRSSSVSQTQSAILHSIAPGRNNAEHAVASPKLSAKKESGSTETRERHVGCCCCHSSCGCGWMRDESTDTARSHRILSLGCGSSTCWLKFCTVFMVLLLLCAFSVAGIVHGIPFYVDSLLALVLTPLGVISRWRLASLNDKIKICKSLEWIPWGTFLANVAASCISIVCSAMWDRYGTSGLCFGVQVGLAGSMSTVSTFMKETVMISRQKGGLRKATAYVSLTIFASMFLSACIYSPIVRM